MNDEIPEAFLAGGDPVPQGRTRRCLSAVEPSGQSQEEEEEEEEEKEENDFQPVPLRRSNARHSQSYVRDPFRRHSWEPGSVFQDAANDPVGGRNLQKLGSGGPREFQSREELETILRPQDQSGQLEYLVQRSQHPSAGPLNGSACGILSKSVSMSGIDGYFNLDAENLPQSPGPDFSNCLWGGSCSQLDVKPSRKQAGRSLQRTLSLFWGMTGKAKNREKEKMKEAKDARYTNGHLFTTISVSGMTMCYACNKSITAKEALICPTCNVTIHNRCKDALANCTKVKQKQQKAALLKNSTALQSVSLRSKTTIRERPSSAIYPSDSFRQSLLGSRRGRSSLSLSKSVSTTNIAGHFNDESPLGLRRILSQSTDSLNMRNRTLSVESLIDEGAEVIYNELMSDFETDEKDFAADSWSLAVDSNFLQQHKKEVMKRQDVIYELIQTELHHVRTLKIMTRLFRTGLLEELQLEPALVQGLFPCVDELSDIHTRFLSQLLERRRQALCPGSTRNFVIHRLGDLLISQFSGSSAEQMRKAYSEFCSRHTKALKLYKELYARDKRFQQFIRKVTRSTVLRRHGVQECILLVTQRITKYPVLIDRILLHSRGNEEEHRDLTTALGLVKELLSAVDQEVHELEKGARLQEIYGRTDSRAQTPVPGKGPFIREELLRRKLLHDGCLLWKTATGRFKDVLMLLMTDVLVFLQEKDQKYIFPALDKPAIISLQNLIVRDIANQEKGMFLISAAPPEMYEVHTASREDRNTWIRVIQQSVRVCPSREDFPLIETEDEAYLRRIKMELQQKDRALVELLQEKVGLFAEMTQFQAEEDGGGGGPLPTLPRGLFRSESLESPRGERLLQDAIREVEGLKDLLVGPGLDLPLLPRESGLSLEPDSSGNTSPGVTTNGETRTFNGSIELCRADSDSSQRDRNGNQLRSPQEEALQRLVNLYGLLHGLQAAVAQQDTLMEARLSEGPERREKLVLSRANSRDGDVGRAGGAPVAPEKQTTELALLQRQHALLQEELRRCRRQGEERAAEAGGLEARLRESEQARARLERETEEVKKRLAALGQAEPLSAEAPWARRPLDPRRRSLPAGDALYLSFTPPSQVCRGHDRLDLPLSTRSIHRTFEDRDGPELGSPEERLQDSSDPDTGSEEESCSRLTPPHSPRDFPRMQDIPEETESRDGEPIASES
ncbi:rho guanine nucleotide exchange factor 2 isoform X4 [Monodelphis domestica]|uniref:rho guanine nucleotide exchange factor 2 isoform X4 n=1 Tax=Monodelphis domestica TaxID=13616 RepID=UPI0024E23227|nr:rho guanine nucleotide exchange factor 2 isoform X4 [Monodelphis domestica]